MSSVNWIFKSVLNKLIYDNIKSVSDEFIEPLKIIFFDIEISAFTELITKYPIKRLFDDHAYELISNLYGHPILCFIIRLIYDYCDKEMEKCLKENKLYFNMPDLLKLNKMLHSDYIDVVMGDYIDILKEDANA